ncbi:hypothetical protein ASF10_19865 [Flavobacterium sp. Leaf82]|uniref:hypothetical protein n=1 Tax=unclassified Flavobacterium TaxID=196869 RepID=UPI0006FA6571|nr:hypothetical protein [Flavobacterium sp. Leaf82]KQO33054.1 hypothetical protein ASF10_19865 [Flavobacterium sp. Leaf82]
MAEEKFPGKIEIGLPTGETWARKYRDSKDEENKKKINSYLIPLESLEAVLRLKKTLDIDAVRAYIGLNELGEQNLIFVGTKLDEKTGIYKDVFGKGESEENGGGDVVYDGSRPCPPYGDPDSPMNE